MTKNRIFATAVLVLVSTAVLLILFALTSRRAPKHPWFAPRKGDHKPLVMAHQGGEGEAPGNTLLAFQRAANAGADILDTDMHSTSDGVLVLIHDENVDRTTNGHGKVRDLPLSEIKQLDAGYNFTTGGSLYPYRGKGITIPTLEELFAAFPRKRLGIEIKPDDLQIITSFCAMIRKHRMEDNVLVSSFRQDTMDAFREACPEVATSATAYEVIKFMKFNTLGLTRALSPAYNCFQIPERAGSTEVITPSFLAAAAERKIPVLPWTINDEQAFQRLAEQGVLAINTDYPERMLHELNVKARNK